MGKSRVCKISSREIIASLTPDLNCERQMITHSVGHASCVVCLSKSANFGEMYGTLCGLIGVSIRL